VVADAGNPAAPSLTDEEAMVALLLSRLRDDPKLLELLHTQESAHQTEAPAAAKPQAAPASTDPMADFLAEQAPAAKPVRDMTGLAVRGWRGAINKMGFSLTKGHRELHKDALDHAQEAVRRPISGHVVIGFSSFKGGCGKSSTAVVLGKTIGALRGEAVLVVDGDVHGTLFARATGASNSGESADGIASMTSLAARLRAEADQQLPVSPAVALASYTQDAGPHLAVIPGSDLYKPSRLSAEDFRNTMAKIRESPRFPVILIDMSQVWYDSDLYGEILKSLDGLVLVSPPDEDSSGFAHQTTGMLARFGVETLAPRRITLVNHFVNINSGVDTEALAAGIRLSDRVVTAETPWDKHLAKPGLVDLDALNRKTREAFQLAAGLLMDTVLN
jgi:MinD-like ATPase involved in chromosome partitioning or flagellar assembly